MREYREQFAKLSVDELWTLYTDVDQILAARIVVKKKELGRCFEQLKQTEATHEIRAPIIVGSLPP